MKNYFLYNDEYNIFIVTLHFIHITITKKEIVHRDLQNLSSKKFEFFKDK